MKSLSSLTEYESIDAYYLRKKHSSGIDNGKVSVKNRENILTVELNLESFCFRMQKLLRRCLCEIFFFSACNESRNSRV